MYMPMCVCEYVRECRGAAAPTQPYSTHAQSAHKHTHTCTCGHRLQSWLSPAAEDEGTGGEVAQGAATSPTPAPPVEVEGLGQMTHVSETQPESEPHLSRPQRKTTWEELKEREREPHHAAASARAEPAGGGQVGGGGELRGEWGSVVGPWQHREMTYIGVSAKTGRPLARSRSFPSSLVPPPSSLPRRMGAPLDGFPRRISFSLSDACWGGVA
jgi:hypothetical protein